jgi:putative beta-lysine N-acetyltransferase
VPRIVDELDAFIRDKGYGKCFAKIPASAQPAFEAGGYRAEARIPGFFRGEEDAVFMGRFFDPDRAVDSQAELLEKVLAAAEQKHDQGKHHPQLPAGYVCEPASPEDAAEVSAVYGKVFDSYPFPIDSEDYIRETMATHVRYFMVRYRGNIVALSSAEQDHENLNVEMTDFATLPEHRGQGLAYLLLTEMEAEMRKAGMRTAYTIARACSAGMNMTFTKRGYTHAGTLVNNTDIAGRLESMNVWYSPLAAE